MGQAQSAGKHIPLPKAAGSSTEPSSPPVLSLQQTKDRIRLEPQFYGRAAQVAWNNLAESVGLQRHAPVTRKLAARYLGRAAAERIYSSPSETLSGGGNGGLVDLADGNVHKEHANVVFHSHGCGWCRKLINELKENTDLLPDTLHLVDIQAPGNMDVFKSIVQANESVGGGVPLVKINHKFHEGYMPPNKLAGLMLQ